MFRVVQVVPSVVAFSKPHLYFETIFAEFWKIGSLNAWYFSLLVSPYRIYEKKKLSSCVNQTKTETLNTSNFIRFILFERTQVLEKCF